MNEQTFRDLVEMGESDTVEFKTSFDKEAIETLVAFANTKGGTTTIGVQNGGKPGGVQLGSKFYNPGNLPHGLTVNQLIRGDYSPSIRNKQIATVFKEAGIIEKYGSEIKRVLEAFNKYALPPTGFRGDPKRF